MPPLYQRSDFPSYRGIRTSHEGRVIYSTQEAWTEAFGYLLGVCLKRLQLELHGGCLFITHDHFDIGHPPDEDPETVARFSDLWRDFHHACWRLLRVNQDWAHGPVYSAVKRTHQGPILDAEEFWRVLCYDTAQAVAAGFFKRSSDYPGLVFLPEDVLTPRVFERNALIDAMDPDWLDYPEESVSIQLSVPRMFSHLTREEYATQFATKLKAYEKQVGPKRAHPVPKARAKCNSLPIGKRFTPEHIAERTRGHRPPPQFTQGYAPVWSSDPDLEVAFKQERREFWTEHDAAYDKFSKGHRRVRFPAGTYGWRRRANVLIGPPPRGVWADQPPWWPD